MIAYLDTHVVVYLAEGSVKRIGRGARRLIERANLLVSPMVLLELELLHEIGRIKPCGRDVFRKVQQEIEVAVCTLPFGRVMEAALGETWTRDPFDRIIVAQAKSNSLAQLLSADEAISQHYPRTVW